MGGGLELVDELDVVLVGLEGLARFRSAEGGVLQSLRARGALLGGAACFGQADGPMRGIQGACQGFVVDALLFAR